MSEEIVDPLTTTAQHSNTPIHPNLTTPKTKNPTLSQTTIQSTVKYSVAQKYSQIDYQTIRLRTKPSYKQRTSHRNNFAEHNYNYVNRSKTPKSFNMNFQTYSISQSQNIPQSTSNSVNFNNQPRSTQDRSENYPFFQQNKNNTNKYYTRNQPSYYTANSSSDDEEYYNQNHQRFYTIQRPRSYSIDQPDIFEPYTRDEQARQPRNNPKSYNNIFQPQNPVNTQSYQPNQLHSEIPLPYYLQQYKVTKS